MDDVSDSESSQSSVEDCPADLTTKETFGFSVNRETCENSRLERRKTSTESNISSDKSNSDNDEAECMAVTDTVCTEKGKIKLNKRNASGNSDKAESLSLPTEAIEQIRKRKRYEKRLRKRQKRDEKQMQVEVHPMKFGISVRPDMDDMELVDIILDALREPSDKMEMFCEYCLCISLNIMS